MKKLLWLIPLCSTLAFSQGTFEHIVILVQENRTPDNLFSACGIPGADVQTNGGSATPLAGGSDFGHGHWSYLQDVAGKWPVGATNYVGSSYIQAYCQLAKTYGFANNMFQTNQGPSLPAHQFLISATSSPADSSDLFVSENAHGGNKDTGCYAPPDSWVQTIAPDGGLGRTFPCFTRSSLMTLLDAARLSWKYYTASAKTCWTGPLALTEYYRSSNIIYKSNEILSDISAKQLSNVSWVIPPGPCSDHPGGTGCGPPWVAKLVNAIGNSPYWNNTVILVTWDDWGGFYDHVPPLANHTGWGTSYIYGFRVPLLVISTHTPAMVDNQPHDFGSILRFVEWNFGLGLIGPGTFADAYADNLSNFFQFGYRAKFSQIRARPLKSTELNSTADPDDD